MISEVMRSSERRTASRRKFQIVREVALRF